LSSFMKKAERGAVEAAGKQRGVLDHRGELEGGIGFESEDVPSATPEPTLVGLGRRLDEAEAPSARAISSEMPRRADFHAGESSTW